MVAGASGPAYAYEIHWRDFRGSRDRVRIESDDPTEAHHTAWIRARALGYTDRAWWHWWRLRDPYGYVPTAATRPLFAARAARIRRHGWSPAGPHSLTSGLEGPDRLHHAARLALLWRILVEAESISAWEHAFGRTPADVLRILDALAGPPPGAARDDAPRRA